MPKLARDLCALWLALALLFGPAAALASRADCECKKACPMHAKRLGCHDDHGAHKTPCHGSGGATLKSAGCGHETAMPSAAPSWRGVMPRTIEIVESPTTDDVTRFVATPPLEPAIEQPIDPPESRSVVA